MSGFVFTADCHLSRLIWNKRPTLVGDSWLAFTALVDHCVQQRAPLLIGGDLFDKTQPDSASVVMFSRAMDRMQQAGLPVWFTQGQHENATPPWASCHPHPRHAHGQLFELPGVHGKFYGLDWQPLGKAKDALRAVPPEATWLLCHQVWLEHMGDHITTPECSIADVPESVTCVLTGDYHVHQVTTHMTLRGMRYLVSPGALRPRNIADAHLPSTAYSVDGGAPGPQSFSTVSLPKRPVVIGTVRTPADVSQLRNAVDTRRTGDDVVGDPFVIARYSSRDWPDAYAVLMASMPSGCHLFPIDTADGVLQLVTDTTAPAIDAATRLDARQLLTAVVQRVTAERGVSDYASDVLELLLATNSPAQSVGAYIERHLSAPA